ncbi:MAG: hypothetical protein NVS3B16_21250 [Vulcanimicrobiaceae bacterium]
MALRRLLVAVPLAVLVAVLAHVAGFGFAHAPGGDHASALFELLAGSLAALLAGAVYRGSVASTPTPIATKHAGRKGAVALAVLAAGALAAIELAEGHSLFGSAGLLPLLALIPLAVAVRSAARCASGLAARAGGQLAVYLRRVPGGSGAGFARRCRCRIRPYGSTVRRVTRGRAPPRFA